MFKMIPDIFFGFKSSHGNVLYGTMQDAPYGRCKRAWATCFSVDIILFKEYIHSKE